MKFNKCIKKIGSEWKTIPRGSNVYAERKTIVNGFSGKEPLPAGKYKIEGFYANAVKIKKGSQEYVFASGNLSKLKRRC